MKLARLFLIGLFLAAIIASNVGTAQAAPAPFEKLTPVNGAANVNYQSVTFTWTPSATPGVRYEICYWKTTNCPNGQWRAVPSGTSYTATLGINKIYFWQVRAIDGTGTTYATGGFWTFNTTPLAPSTFTKQTPFDKAVDVPLDTSLVWNTSQGATSYEYCIDDTLNSNCDSAWLRLGLVNTVLLNNLQYGTTYEWQVQARNAAGPIPADGGTWFTFTTEIPAPFGFFKLSPQNEVSGQPNVMHFYWSEAGWAEDYEFCLDADTTNPCTEPADWVSNGLDTHRGPVSVSYGEDYYWQVRAVNASAPDAPTYADDDNNVNTRDGWTFSVLSNALTAFEKIIPTADSINQMVDPWLVWSASENAARYEYCINTSETCPTGSWHSTGLEMAVHVMGLEPGTTYYWQVRAINIGETETRYANEEIAWWAFTTAPISPYSSDQSFTLVEDTPFDQTLTSVNPSGGDVFFSPYGAWPAGLTLSDNGRVTYNPTANFNGVVSFMFRVSDDINPPSGPYTATITVTGVNDPPVLETIPDKQILTGGMLEFPIIASDPDTIYGDTITVAFSALPNYADFDPTSGIFSCYPVWSSNSTNQVSYTVTVEDVAGRTVSDTFTVTVVPYQMMLPLVRR